MIMAADDYDDIDNWEVKQHARVSKKRIGSIVPAVKFKIRVRDDSIEGPNPYRWDDLTSYQIFGGKRVIVFSLPGAFTPTCSSQQLPGYEALYNEFKAQGIDEIYCLSVNDAFVMNDWGRHLGVKNIKLIPDGNGTFSRLMGRLVDKSAIGFGMRSHRYAAVIKDGYVEKMFDEEGREDNYGSDPYGESSPENVLQWLTTDK